MPQDNFDEAFNEDKIKESIKEKIIEHIVKTATDETIKNHIKSGFGTLGIEGTEDVFRRAFKSNPVLLERYQKTYNQLIGRA